MTLVGLVGAILGTAELLRFKEAVVVEFSSDGILIIVAGSSTISGATVALESLWKSAAINSVSVGAR